MKKIRRIRMTTTTSKLVFIQSENAPLETGGHNPLEICPTCGQRLLTTSGEQTPPLPSPVVCPNEHDPDES